MLKIFIILLFSTIAFSSHAQSNEYISSAFPGSDVVGVFEIDEKIIVTVSNGLNADYHGIQDYSLVFYELNLQVSGTDISMNEIHRVDLDDGVQVFSMDFIDETKEWIWVEKKDLGFDHVEYRVNVYTNTFNLISNQSVIVTGHPIYFQIDSYNGKTCILGSILKSFDDKIFYVEYWHHDLNGLQPIFIGQSSPNKMFWITDMRFDKSTGFMLVFYYNGIAILDSSLFQIKNLDILSGISTQDHGNVTSWGENYFSHGARDSAWDDGRRKMVIHKYDTGFHVLKADTLGWVLQDNYPFVVKSLDIQDSMILVGGHLDGPFNGPDFHGNKKMYYLAKYDIGLNQIWYKEYGGDKAYTFNGLKLLVDDAVVAYGFITDDSTGFRYGYLVYVNENGDIISSIEVPSTPCPTLTVVNPGDDMLNILNPEALDAQFVLYTLDGKTVLQTNVLRDASSHDLSTWPAGMYPYVFYLNGQPVKSGKWVKI